MVECEAPPILNLGTGNLALEKEHSIRPAYNDIGFCDISSIALDILLYQLIPHCKP